MCLITFQRDICPLCLSMVAISWWRDVPFWVWPLAYSSWAFCLHERLLLLWVVSGVRHRVMSCGGFQQLSCVWPLCLSALCWLAAHPPSLNHSCQHAALRPSMSHIAAHFMLGLTLSWCCEHPSLSQINKTTKQYGKYPSLCAGVWPPKGSIFSAASITWRNILSLFAVCRPSSCLPLPLYV